VGKNNRTYRSAKRSKELKRQKKQEEKRQERLNKARVPQGEGPELAPAEEGPDAAIPADEGSVEPQPET
jgi:hypothetical protein